MPLVKAFLLSNHVRWYWITLLIIVGTVLSLFFFQAHFFPLVYIRIILGAIFLLLLPGFCLTKVIFPSDIFAKIDKIERFALSFGLSLALIPIIGVILNYSPWGIRLISLTISIAGITTVFATIAFVRSYLIYISNHIKKLDDGLDTIKESS